MFDLFNSLCFIRLTFLSDNVRVTIPLRHGRFAMFWRTKNVIQPYFEDFTFFVTDDLAV